MRCSARLRHGIFRRGHAHLTQNGTFVIAALRNARAHALRVEDALTRLAKVDEQLARIVELRFYGGLEYKEVATALGMSLRSVERGWQVARAWLASAMEENDTEKSAP